MYYLYILKCADKTLYTGITVNLQRRTKEHNSSNLGAKYTRSRRPVKLVYSKKFRSRSTACLEEARIKTLSRKEKLEMIKNNSSSTPNSREWWNKED
ncbi:GIY-YIG nuclease family protein [Patescibacteria group bacterium]|nr:GIY-YIG nuclease family protein [Patescibacteria group bacterium]MBU3999698.1 GIY-YIG nuclease family protein [Patescibacteria group bacterium]MBU4056753.1 GIY-YIG nuclease family protein [Patescibacteria group bacterium]MBU4368253.1 GIY-YIG nuclease family protein [Patescibacteria group bacterium]